MLHVCQFMLCMDCESEIKIYYYYYNNMMEHFLSKLIKHSTVTNISWLFIDINECKKIFPGLYRYKRMQKGISNSKKLNEIPL